MPTFGKRASERAADTAQQDYYVKTFGKENRTDIRFLWDDPRNNFVEIKEHFDKAQKISYPCAKFEGAPNCIGCDYPVEHPEYADLDEYFPGLKFNDAKDERKKKDPGWATRDTSSKWLFPAIDPKGFVSVYKIGYKFWTDLAGLYDLVGTITDKDYAIIKTGDSWNSTSYQAQPISQAYDRPAKVSVPTPEAISDVLGSKYVYAMEKYGMDVSGIEMTPPKPEAQNSAPDPEPVQSPVNPAPVQDPDNIVPVDPVGPGTEPVFNSAEASAGEMKDWLTEHGVEFPARAPRSVLSGLVNDKQNEMHGKPPF